jgi:hypothetical protein
MLDAVRIPSNELFAVLIAISFAAGLNVYATVATLGLLAHTGVFSLPPALQLLCWRPVAQRRVGTLCVVFHPPLFDHDLCLLQRVKDLSVQAFIPQFPVCLSDLFGKPNLRPSHSWSAKQSGLRRARRRRTTSNFIHGITLSVQCITWTGSIREKTYASRGLVCTTTGFRLARVENEPLHKEN